MNAKWNKEISGLEEASVGDGISNQFKQNAVHDIQE